MTRYTVIDERAQKITPFQRQVIEQFAERPWAVMNADTGRRVRHYPTWEEAMQEAKRRNEIERGVTNCDCGKCHRCITEDEYNT